MGGKNRRETINHENSLMPVISELFSLYTFIYLLFDIAVIFIFSVYCANRLYAR